MDSIKRIKRELKYTGSILKIYQDTMQMPDGRTALWDFVEHGGAAAVLPVLPDGRILMVRQYRSAIEGPSLEIPAGCLDSKDEKGIVCATRELEEETGWKAGRIEPLITLHMTVAYCNEKVEVFLARDLTTGERHLDPDEYIGIETYTLEDLKDMIFRGEITDSKTVAGIMAYNALLQREA